MFYIFLTCPSQTRKYYIRDFVHITPLLPSKLNMYIAVCTSSDIIHFFTFKFVCFSIFRVVNI